MSTMLEKSAKAAAGLPGAEEILAGIRRVLVPLDGSPFAEHALPWALEIAHRADARLDLVTVHTAAPPSLLGELPSAERWHEEARIRSRNYLSELADEVVIVEDVSAETSLLEGKSVSRELSRYVEDREIDLVVMTTHGRTGADRAWLGSVAESLLRRVRVPVLLVRAAQETRGARRRDRLFRRVMVALDGSALAEHALDFGLTLGSLDGARFELVRAVDPTPVAATLYMPHGIDAFHDLIERDAEQAAHYLEEQRRRLERRGYAVDTLVLSDPDPARALLQHMETGRFDLLVTGTHGRRGVSRLLLGSVADKLVRGAGTPVLVVPRRREP